MGRGDQIGPHEQLHRQVLPGLRLDLHIPLPGAEPVDPGLDGVEVAAELSKGKLSLPAVVHLGLHGHTLPVGFSRPAIQHLRSQNIVAVHEDIRLHPQPVPHYSFGGEHPPVYFRGHRLDGYPLPGRSRIKALISVTGHHGILPARDST